MGTNNFIQKCSLYTHKNRNRQKCLNFDQNNYFLHPGTVHLKCGRFVMLVFYGFVCKYKRKWHCCGTGFGAARRRAFFVWNLETIFLF